MYHTKLTGWIHLVMNYIGPNNGEGITLYIDGAEVDSDTTKYGPPYSAGDGRIVVGRRSTDRNERYVSVRLDELIYFNAALTDTQVQSIYNSA